MASIDYAIPIGLFDQPLVFSLASTGARLAVHAEGITRWSGGFQSFSVQPFLYTGGDLTFQMVFNAIPFAVQLGAAARINTSSPDSFDPATDIGIYLAFGSAGLAGGAKTGLTPKASGNTVVPR